MLKSLQYNKGSLFDIDFTQRAWSKLEDLFNEQPDHLFQIDGLFINTKSKYGDRPFVAFDKVYLADLPQHMLEVVKDMIGDPEVVEEINSGKLTAGRYALRLFYDQRQSAAIRTYAVHQHSSLFIRPFVKNNKLSRCHKNLYTIKRQALF